MTSGRRLALALLAVLVLAGCGQQSSPARMSLARYVTQVNHVETALATPVATITHVSADASRRGHGTLTGAETRRLVTQLSAAVAQIRAQEARLQGLRAPPAATHLRALLLRYTGQEAALTHQLGLLIAFLPRFGTVVAPVGPDLARLERALGVHSAAGTSAVAAVYAAKATALRAFRAQAQGIIDRLRGLTPPAVSVPTYRAQISALRGMATSAGRLASALAGGAPGNVTPLLVQFERAALATRTRSVQRAQIAAIHAYDHQTAQLTRLAEDISRERLRLASNVH